MMGIENLMIAAESLGLGTYLRTGGVMAARELTVPPVRRPFLVALALTLMTAAVQWTPPVPLPPPAPVRPLAVLPAVTAPRSAAPVDSAALERAVVARFQHHPLARLLMRRTREQAMACGSSHWRRT